MKKILISPVLLSLLVIISLAGLYYIYQTIHQFVIPKKTISQWSKNPVSDNGYIANLFGVKNDNIQAWIVGKFNKETPNSLIQTGNIYLVGYKDGDCSQKMYLIDIADDVSTKLGPILTQLPTTNFDQQYKAFWMHKDWEIGTGIIKLTDNVHIFGDFPGMRSPELEFPGVIHVYGNTYKLTNRFECSEDAENFRWNLLFSDIKDNLFAYGHHQDLGTAYRFKGDITEKIVFKTVDGSYITYKPVK